MTDMLKLFLETALIRDLPGVLIIVTIFFLFFKGLLKYRDHTIIKAAMLVISAAAVIGILYGSLRFAGVIAFPSDNTMSWNWFDASWRDDGYRFIYPCGCVLIGFASAILSERMEQNERRPETEA